MWYYADMQIEGEIDWTFSEDWEFLWDNQIRRLDSQKKRRSNHKYSRNLLIKKEIKFIEKPNSHFIIWDYDFWATTGLFIHRKTKKRWRWVYNLIKKLW